MKGVLGTSGNAEHGSGQRGTSGSAEHGSGQRGTSGSAEHGSGQRGTSAMGQVWCTSGQEHLLRSAAMS